MSKKVALFAAAAVLAVGLVPSVSTADHAKDCGQLFVFTGQQLPQNGVSSGQSNLGSYGCTASGTNAAVHANTNYITPGAVKVRVGAVSYPANDDPENKPTGGTIQFNATAAKTLTWTWDNSNGRWLSQTLDIPANTTKITAVATLQPRDYPDSPARKYTVVYNKLA